MLFFQSVNSSPPWTKWPPLSQTTFLDVFPRMKSFVFWLKIHRSLFLRIQLIITQHWFTSHYLNQCWTNSLTYICGTRGRWVKLPCAILVQPVQEIIISHESHCEKCIFILQNDTLRNSCKIDSCLLRFSLQWRHNVCDGVSNLQPRDCSLNRLFKAQIKEIFKALRHWPWWGEFTGDLWIPAQRASNAENVSIWWRHHVYIVVLRVASGDCHKAILVTSQQWFR